MAGDADNVKVIVRFRPESAMEERNGSPCVDFASEQQVTVSSTEGGSRVPIRRDFTLDRVFPPSTTQEEVFLYAAKPVVDCALDGFNATIFAYGQTGSGKTYTMQGASVDDPATKGIIPRIVEALFDSVTNSPDTATFTIQCCYIELYLEHFRDLLNPNGPRPTLHERNGEVVIEDCQQIYVRSVDETMALIRRGTSNRVIAETSMNVVSSRSHSIFVIHIEKSDLVTGTRTSSRLHLVDLAGSEKVGKSGASGQTLQEARKINQSLLALGNVINALTDPASTYVPYRDSKLTRLLQDSLGGNSKTTLITCCSVSSYNDAETISTLRFGCRAKSIKNSARVNKQLSAAELQRLLEAANKEIARLQGVIRSLNGDPSQKLPSSDLQEQLKEEHDKLVRLEEMQEELLLQAQLLTTQCDEQRARADAAETSAEEARREAERAHYEANEARLRAEQLEVQNRADENAESMENHPDMTAELEALQRQVNELHTQLDEQIAANDRMRQELAQADSQLESHRLELSRIREDRDSQKRRAQALEEAMESARNELLEAEGSLKKTTDSSQAEITQLRTQLQVAQKQVESTTNFYQRRHAWIDTRERYLSKELAELRAHASELQRRLQSSEERASRLDVQLQERDAEIQREASQHREDMLEKCSQVETTMAQLEELRSAYKKLMESVDAPALRLRCQSLEANLERLRDVYIVTRRKNSDIVYANYLNGVRIATRDQRIATLEKQIQADASSYMAQLADRDAEISQLRQRLDTLVKHPGESPAMSPASALAKTSEPVVIRGGTQGSIPVIHGQVKSPTTPVEIVPETPTL